MPTSVATLSSVLRRPEALQQETQWHEEWVTDRVKAIGEHFFDGEKVVGAVDPVLISVLASVPRCNQPKYKDGCSESARTVACSLSGFIWLPRFEGKVVVFLRAQATTMSY